MLLSIDPGSTQSAYCIMDEQYKPVEFAKIPNYDLLTKIFSLDHKAVPVAVIEKIAGMGMAVGQEVFDTCNWSGRFHQALVIRGVQVEYVTRLQEKICLCGTARAKDPNIRQALLDRFGVVGVKANKGWFYGVSKDVWSAIAVGTTWMDKEKEAQND